MRIKLLTISLILCTVFAYGQNGNNKQTNKSKMNIKENAEIKKNSEILKMGMIEYIQYGETEYTKSDVEKCMTLIDNFLVEISNSDSKENGMKIVKKVVLELNDLNKKCEYELIETDQREFIAEIIIIAGHLKGYNDRNEDITEDWREW
ncbi:hypothetical protein ATE84_4960 [Aquimarina sp. MAR_2010_214]|uniref:hypothetical protein n=1 Tax=Aquimarina sp. MAR_2010_214 TaxID=1250026 RepID=UPI000C6FCF3A|nr:hypothetical protein [Aquimarina sp. MAR_2010_214]PKV52832.1 hypothetical protein ATE84_4960 [Aquimarina sp. MAR_2010_214]